MSGLKKEPTKSISERKEAFSIEYKPRKKEKSIIVLPFANMSPNPEDEYFSDGLTEEIITNLAHLQSLRVISRSTSMVLKGTSKDIMTIGQELGVNYVLEGSVRKFENKIRITAQLIDASTDEHLWAERFDGTLDDIFDVQERIAKNIADTLKIKLSPEEKINLTNRPIQDPEAYDLWILAKNEFHKLSEAGINRGLVLIKRAIEIEGDNAQLYATMGYIHWIQYDFGIKHDLDVLDLIQKSAVRALDLDPKLPDALIVKGLSLYKRGDLPGCLKFMLLGSMQGGYSTEQFMASLGLGEMGLIDEAYQYVQEAVLMSPLDFLPLVYQSLVNMLDGKTDRALSIIRDACDRLAPEEPFVGFWLAHIAALNGDNRLAYSECEKVASYRSRPFSEFCRLHQLAMDSNHKGVIEHIEKSGIADIAKTDEYWPICLAIALTLIGEYDEAIAWIKRSVDWGFSNSRFLAEHNKFLKPLRNSNRFQEIIDQARRQHETFLNEVYKPLIQSQKQ
jgi:TolB-like protein